MTVTQATGTAVVSHAPVADVTAAMQVGSAFYAALPSAALGWCPRCLADIGAADCCTKARAGRLVRVPTKWCGCLVGDVCTCAALEVGTR